MESFILLRDKESLHDGPRHICGKSELFCDGFLSFPYCPLIQGYYWSTSPQGLEHAFHHGTSVGTLGQGSMLWPRLRRQMW